MTTEMSNTNTTDYETDTETTKQPTEYWPSGRKKYKQKPRIEYFREYYEKNKEKLRAAKKKTYMPRNGKRGRPRTALSLPEPIQV